MLYIHIGYHKTGTTSIQKFLYENSEMMRKLGYLYPTTGSNGFSHGELANNIKIENLTTDREKVWQRLEKEIIDSRLQKAVLSSECFLESKAMPSVLSKLINYERFSPRIVVYLRRQDLWIQSLYQEVVRDPMRRFSGDILELREIRKGFLDYYSIIELWAQSFGRKCIIVRPFEISQFFNRDLISDFLYAIGVEESKIGRFESNTSFTNTSMKRPYVEFLRRCNLLPFTKEEYLCLVDALKTLSDNDNNFEKNWAYMPKDNLRDLIENCRHSNKLVAINYLNKLDNKLFYSDFFSEDQAVEDKFTFGSTMQREIFSRLPQDVQENIEFLFPKMTNVPDGDNILPSLPTSTQERLEREVMRQRHEIRRLYCLLENIYQKINNL